MQDGQGESVWDEFSNDGRHGKRHQLSGQTDEVRHKTAKKTTKSVVWEGSGFGQRRKRARGADVSRLWHAG